jgi:hypothetical protein
MKYLLVILLITSISSLQSNSEENCFFEGILKIRHQESNKEDFITIITMTKNVVRQDGFNLRYKTIITDYENSYSQYFDDNDNMIYHLNFETSLTSDTKKIDLSPKYILGYKCIAYENITEKYHFEEHSTQFRTVFWIAEDLNSCLYSQYQRLNPIYSNPLNKIALRIEKQIVEDGKAQEKIFVSEVQEITPKKIDYDLRDINNK